MKLTTLILSLLILGSCVSKKKCIEKYCTTKQVDTTIIVRDTIVIDSTHTDTVFSSKVDSIFIQQGKLSIKYIKVRDSVYLSGKYEADTIFHTDTLRISVPVTIPNGKLSNWELFKSYWMWLLLALVAGFIIAKLR